MRVVQRVTAFSAVVLMACATQVSAQTGFANMVDHIHLAVPDQPKAVAWYGKHFGGKPMTEAPDRLMFGETRVIFQKNENAKPSSGSVVDHIGFSVTDLDAAMKNLEADGAKVTAPARDVAGIVQARLRRRSLGRPHRSRAGCREAGPASHPPAGPGSGGRAGLVRGQGRRDDRKAEGSHRRDQLRRRVGAGAEGRDDAEPGHGDRSHRVPAVERRHRRRRIEGEERQGDDRAAAADAAKRSER